MMEIMAPFLVIKYNKHNRIPLGKCYAYFHSFMKKFYPYTLTSKYYNQNGVLPYTALVMNISELLLKYHCPSVSNVLGKFNIALKFFITHWVMTLFH